MITTENFPILVRTKQFWNMLKRDGDRREPVHIPMKLLGDVDREALVRMGEIAITQKRNENGHSPYYYAALKEGSKDISLLEPLLTEPLDKLTTTMREHLKRVTLKQGTGSTDFFDCFLKFNRQSIYLNLFFKIDSFSRRVHTPVSNFHRIYRPNILLDEETTGSLDVATMQPVLLGWILSNLIGSNEYSQWIDAGQDIYESIREKAKLRTRDEGKERFFEIIFSPADKRLAAMFGDADWITWVNDFKSHELPPNPHTMEKRHSNLAFMLQRAEVKIMREVWQGLHDAGIVFLSVHDEVIVKAKDIAEAELIFSNVLSKYFRYYKLCSKHPTTEPQAISGSLIPDEVILPSIGETAVNSLKIGNHSGFPPLTDNRVNLDEIMRYMETIPEPSGPVQFAGGITITEPMQYINYQYQALKSNNGYPTASAPYELLKGITELCKYQKLAENAI